MILMNSPASTLPSFLAEVDFFSRMVIALVTVAVYTISSARAKAAPAAKDKAIRKEMIFFMRPSLRAMPDSTSELDMPEFPILQEKDCTEGCASAPYPRQSF